MEIILLEKIRNLGDVGQVVNVKDGYGRNFLLKFGKALRADKKNIDYVKKLYKWSPKRDLKKIIADLHFWMKSNHSILKKYF